MQDTVGRKPGNKKAMQVVKLTELIFVAALGLFLFIFRKKPLLLHPHS